MNPVAAPSEPIHPVYLVTGEPEAVVALPSTFEIAMQLLVIGAVVALATAVVVLIIRRQRRAAAAMDPADLALRSLARRMRLRRADRAVLRQLASSPVPGWPSAVHPVALLVSRHAFETAAAISRMHRGESAPDPDVLDRLRRRAFGASPHSQPTPT